MNGDSGVDVNTKMLAINSGGICTGYMDNENVV